MARLLGIDVGTSGCKAVLIDGSGTVLREASTEHPTSYPKPLWSEQDPEDWWTGVERCITAIGVRDPDAVSVTGQMHGAVFLDQAGAAIRPAILWNDQRTSEECAEIEETVGSSRVREITLNPPLTGLQAPKILWLRNHELSNYLRVRKVLLPKDYIRFRLTGALASDVSDSSGTGLFNVARREWSAEVLSALELSPDWFPDAYESWEATAETVEGPFCAGIPVAAGAGDQAAGAVGTGAVDAGIISIALGTSGVVFAAIAEPVPDPTGVAHVFCHANGGWHAMGVMLSCGGAVRWARDLLYPGQGYDLMDSETAEAPLGCRGATFLPYLAGERCPHSDPLARGAFAGLTLGHSRAELARSVLEGVTFGLREGLDRLVALGAQPREIRLTGGGAKSALWRQLLADVLEQPVARIAADEGPAMGAAMLAGVAAGVWPSVAEACRAVVRLEAATEPSGADYREPASRFGRLYPSLRSWQGQ